MDTAKFYKVSYEQFEEGFLDYNANASKEIIHNIYNELKLPKRQRKDQQGMIFILLLMFILNLEKH